MEIKKTLAAILLCVLALLAAVLLLFAVRNVNEGQGLTSTEIGQVQRMIDEALTTPTPTPTASPSASATPTPGITQAPFQRTVPTNQVLRGVTPAPAL